LRILIAGANYAPESTSVAPFTTGLAEHLSQQGHEVTVATTFPFYPLWRWFYRPKHWRIRENINGVDVWRTKIVLPPRRTATWRIIFDTSIALTTAITALSIPRVDVAICVSPPVQTTLIGWVMRFKFGKCVMLVKDLPTQAASSVGMLQDGLLLRVGQMVERSAYKHASHIVVISSAFAAYLRSLGVEAARISEIPDWADLESIQPAAPDYGMRNALGAGPNDFLVVHSGNMGAKQDLLNVVAAAAILRDKRHIKLALVGDGTERPKIAEAIATMKVENLKLLPLQASTAFPKVLAAADVLLVNQAPLVVDSVLPSKLLAYMASARPVLAAAHSQSTTAGLVGLASCGVVAEPGRPEALAAAIQSMASSKYDLEAMGRRGRAYAEAHFDRRTVFDRWDDLLAELIQVSAESPRSGR
jgi:glycosyltransferase involved in cell wall biosynthesis